MTISEEEWLRALLNELKRIRFRVGVLALIASLPFIVGAMAGGLVILGFIAAR